jgi:hypothetical protein
MISILACPQASFDSKTPARTIGVIVYNWRCHLVCGETSLTFEDRYHGNLASRIESHGVDLTNLVIIGK